MISGKTVFAACMAAASVFGAGADTVAYTNAGGPSSWWGTGKSETYDVAVRLGPDFKGLEVRSGLLRSSWNGRRAATEAESPWPFRSPRPPEYTWRQRCGATAGARRARWQDDGLPGSDAKKHPPIFCRTGKSAYLCSVKAAFPRRGACRHEGEYQSGQMGQTVNLLVYTFGGSNPSSPT